MDVRNYGKRFRLDNGKWAFQQPDEVAARAKDTIKLIRELWSPPSHFYHFKEGGHVAAIKLHRTNRHFAKIDLSNFFGQISRNRIIRCLKNLGFSFDEAESIAIVSTVRMSATKARFVLPFGFVQSPVLASIALDHSDLGSKLLMLAEVLRVSVYVDDIILSSDDEAVVQGAFARLSDAAARSNFELNAEKCVECAPSINAFNISLAHDVVEVTPGRLKAFKEEIQASGKSARSSGIYRYVATVNDGQAKELLLQFPWLGLQEIGEEGEIARYL